MYGCARFCAFHSERIATQYGGGAGQNADEDIVLFQTSSATIDFSGKSCFDSYVSSSLIDVTKTSDQRKAKFLADNLLLSIRNLSIPTVIPSTSSCVW